MVMRSKERFSTTDGMTLVEVLVAVVIVGIVLTAAVNSLVTSFVSITRAETRTKATALANESLEHLRVLPWQQLGFYESDFGDEPWPEHTVILGEARTPAALAPLPVETIEDRGGVTFEVEREILYEDFRELRVTVSWVGRRGPESLSVETTRAPSGQAATAFMLSQFEASPVLVYIHDNGSIDTGADYAVDPMQFTAVTSADANTVHVEYTDRNDTAQRVDLTSDDRREWATEWSSHAFPNGYVDFTFVAMRAVPIEVEVIGTTVVRFLQPLAINSVTHEPITVPSAEDNCTVPGEQFPDVEVAIDTDGTADEDDVTLTWNGQEVLATFQSELRTLDGGVFIASIPGDTYTGSFTLSVLVERVDGATATLGQEIEVQVEPVPGCEGT